MKPLLSILIPAIPSRLELSSILFLDLEHQSGKDHLGAVEILMLLDNKRRSVGMKRQALLDMAQGEYVAFVDDDDQIGEKYIFGILKAILDLKNPKPDVVVWPFLVTINGGDEGLVIPSIKYIPKEGEAVAEYKPPITYRPPHHLCCFKTELARKGHFPDKQHGEDFEWARQVWPHLKTENMITDSLYHYVWNSNVTEAEPV